MKKLLLSLICLQSVFVFGQAPIIQWQRCYGGSSTEHVYSILENSDGSYIFAGVTSSTNGDVNGYHGVQDAWVVQINTDNNILWKRCYGGSSGDSFIDFQHTTDGGYIAVGHAGSSNGDVLGTPAVIDYWIVKLGASGNILWQKLYGGSARDYAHSVQQTSDGGYIVGGVTDSNNGDVTGHHGGYDYWILKLNASGNIIWKKTYGGSGDDELRRIKQTPDGGYIVIGESDSNDGDVGPGLGGKDVWILKLDSNGNIVWKKIYGGSSTDNINDIVETSDGGYLFAGRTSSNLLVGNWVDAWIFKTDANGNISWEKKYGGTQVDSADKIIEIPGDGYVIGASSNSNNGDAAGNSVKGYWMIKTDSDGEIEWQKIYGGVNGSGGRLNSIKSTMDGGYILAGYTSQNNDGDVGSNHGNFDIWIVKLESDCSPVINTITETACGSFTWTTGNGQTYTSSTTATHTIIGGAANGCDSIVTLNLTINQPTTHTITATACESYTLNSQTYTSSGTYTQTLTNADNCDSTITLNLAINQPSTHTITATACESYTLNAQTYTSSGTYTQTLTNANNCDSTITLNLTINQPTTHTITATACESYTLNGQTYTSSGTYTQTLTNANNCDSTITLNLTINQPTTNTITATACESYTLNGQTYTSSGTYIQTLTNVNNCDSTITLNLTINNVDVTVSISGITLTANQTGATYQWIDCNNGNSPVSGATSQSFTSVANGNYAVEVTANGCTETSDCVAVYSVGVESLEQNEWSVFPNPGDGLFTIKGESLNDAEAIKIQNTLGQELKPKTTVSSGTITVDLTNEPTGVYLLEINNRIVKLIKQ